MGANASAPTLGASFVHSTQPEPLPVDTELGLVHFTELVATAMANVQARADLQRLAEKQPALRRVAEHVARGAAATEVFATVAEEPPRSAFTRPSSLRVALTRAPSACPSIRDTA